MSSLSFCKWLTLSLASLFLVACPDYTPPEPKPEIKDIKVTVLDRFDKPVADFGLEMKREYRRPMSLQPYESVDTQRTNEEGVAVFPLARVDDWIDESWDDHRFSGSIKLEEGKTEYVLKLNKAFIGTTSFASGVDPGEYDKVAERIRDTFDKIFAHYVEGKHTEFLSLKEYVNLGVISLGESDRILRLSHRMNESSTGINFGWGGKDLRVADFETPISWVDSH